MLIYFVHNLNITDLTCIVYRMSKKMFFWSCTKIALTLKIKVTFENLRKFSSDKHWNLGHSYLGLEILTWVPKMTNLTFRTALSLANCTSHYRAWLLRPAFIELLLELSLLKSLSWALSHQLSFQSFVSGALSLDLSLS